MIFRIKERERERERERGSGPSRPPNTVTISNRSLKKLKRESFEVIRDFLEEKKFVSQ
jgi:hypothetical protein